MISRLFIAFSLWIFASIAILVSWFQSRSFAQWVSPIVRKELRRQANIEVTFEKLRVGFFPPSFTVVAPSVKTENNLPFDWSLEEVQAVFFPFQAISGSFALESLNLRGLRVNGKGSIEAAFSSVPRQNKTDAVFRLDEFLRKLPIERLELSDSLIEFSDFNFYVRALGVRKFGLKSTEASLQLIGDSLRWKIWNIESIDTSLVLRASRLQINQLKIKAPGIDVSVEGGASMDSRNLKLPERIQGAIYGVVSSPDQLDSAVRKVIDAQIPSGVGWQQASFQWVMDLTLDPSKKKIKRAQGPIQCAVRGFSFHGIDWENITLGFSIESNEDQVFQVQDISLEAKQEIMPRRVLPQFHPAKGGRVQLLVDPLSVSVDAWKHVPITVRAQLTDVHLHQLLGNGSTGVAGLDFRTSGKIVAQFSPDFIQAGKISGELAVHQFLYDATDSDDRNLKSSPLEIVKVKNIGIIISADLYKDSLEINDSQLILANSKVGFAGRIDFKNGINLAADGDFDLQDISELAEIKFHGSGSIKAQIFGPFNSIQVLFQPQLQDVEYVSLLLGKVSGDILLSTGEGTLAFQKMKVEKNRSSLGVDGLLKLRNQPDPLNIQVHAKSVLAADVLPIFTNLVRDLSWFPFELSGELTGNFSIIGPLNPDLFSITGMITGDILQYKGERLDWIQAQIGYQQGEYFANNIISRKGHGKLNGRISFSPEKGVEWSLVSEHFLLSDVNWIDDQGFLPRGDLDIDSFGKYSQGRLVSESYFRVRNGAVGKIPLGESDLFLVSQGANWDLTAKFFDHKVVVRAQNDGETKGNADISFTNANPMLPLLFLNSQLGIDGVPVGSASGFIRLAWLGAGQSRKVRISELSVDELSANYRNFSIVLQKPSGLYLNGARESVVSVIRMGDQIVNVQTSIKSGELDIVLSGYVPTSVFTLIQKSVRTASGRVRTNFTIHSNFSDFLMNGRMESSGAEVKLDFMDSPVQLTRFVVDIENSVFVVRQGDLQLGGGKASLTGVFEPIRLNGPKMSLHVSLLKNRIKVVPFQYAVVEGEIDIKGDARPYRIEGLARIEDAMYSDPMLKNQGNGFLELPKYLPAGDGQLADRSWFTLALEVLVSKGLKVRNDLFDAEWAGSVEISGPISSPSVLGALQIIKGQLIFNDRVFDLQSAKIDFDKRGRLDPAFSIVGLSEIGDTKVRLFSQGRIKSFRIELSSDPALAQSEILQLLALGTTQESLERNRASGRTTINQGAAASAVLQSLDFNRDIQSKTGFRIRLSEAVNTQDAVSALTADGVGAYSSSPKIEISREIVKNWNVSVGSTVGIGQNNQREINTEVNLAPGFSLIGVWNVYGSSRVDEVRANEQLNSYGIDLKFQKRF